MPTGRLAFRLRSARQVSAFIEYIDANRHLHNDVKVAISVDGSQFMVI